MIYLPSLKRKRLRGKEHGYRFNVVTTTTDGSCCCSGGGGGVIVPSPPCCCGDMTSYVKVLVHATWTGSPGVDFPGTIPFTYGSNVDNPGDWASPYYLAHSLVDPDDPVIYLAAIFGCLVTGPHPTDCIWTGSFSISTDGIHEVSSRGGFFMFNDEGVANTLDCAGGPNAPFYSITGVDSSGPGLTNTFDLHGFNMGTVEFTFAD